MEISLLLMFYKKWTFQCFFCAIFAHEVTHVHSGISVHDSLESIEVKLWSTIVIHFSYGLSEPVESDADLHVWVEYGS